ncbi:MAG TPA: ferrous iron transport protein B [Nitrospirota bacterium]
MSAKGLRKLLLVGNPNVGKSVIFGYLTGKYATVSNYPGTTVEVSQGNALIGTHNYTVMDTPGVNSLLPMSEDEVVTRNIILNEEFDSIVQVADTKNLRRSLLITLQLSEMGVPFVMALNMADEAENLGISTDLASLSEKLGVDTFSTTATRRKGITKLMEAIPAPRRSVLTIRYTEDIEKAILAMEPLLPESRISRRSLALMLLGGDTSLKSWLHSRLDRADVDKLDAIVKGTQAQYSDSLGYQINKERLTVVDRVAVQTQTRLKKPERGVRRWLGDITMHPVWGLPVLIVVLGLMYEFVGVLGAGTMVNFMETQVFAKWINPYAIGFFQAVMPVNFLRELFVGPYGIVTMALTYAIAIVLPITATFFIAFGMLEDSGYLPRLAIMVNRIFKTIGLNGKAVLPMVLGLGCCTMATLTTRILETKKERIIVTFLLALAIPCSAQLGVIMGMLSSISPMATLIWVGVLVVVLFLAGYLASIIVPGDPSDFILELPPIRMPKLKNIFMKTIGRIEWYLKEAVPLFVLGTLILFTADKTMLLKLVEKAGSPIVVNLLGLPPKTTEAFLIGFLRRDYGAAGLFTMQKAGLLTPVQVLVSVVTITLFVPCIAQFFVTIKERGMKTAVIMLCIVFPFAVLTGAVLNFGLNAFGITLQ